VSSRLAGRQAQARQKKLAVLGLTEIAGTWYHRRGDGPEPCDYISCVVQLTHMSVAGGQKSIRLWEARVSLDR
jgi:hypothetical protein